MFSTQTVTLYIQASQYYVNIVYTYLTIIIEWLPIATPLLFHHQLYDSVYHISNLSIKPITSYGIIIN